MPVPDLFKLWKEKQKKRKAAIRARARADAASRWWEGCRLEVDLMQADFRLAIQIYNENPTEENQQKVDDAAAGCHEALDDLEKARKDLEREREKATKAEREADEADVEYQRGLEASRIK